MRRQTPVLPATHEFENNLCSNKEQSCLSTLVRMHVSQTSDKRFHVSETTWHKHERQPVTVQFGNDRNTQPKIMAGYFISISCSMR